MDRSDAVAGLLSLSPLNSPCLASCIDMLGTPDLVGIARERAEPTQMWLPQSRIMTKRAVEPAHPDPAPIPCPSPTPLTQDTMSTWEPADLMYDSPKESKPMASPLKADEDEPIKGVGTLMYGHQSAGSKATDSVLPRRPSLIDMLSGSME